MYAMYSKAYTPKKVCMLGYPLAYTNIAATIKTSKKISICTPPRSRVSHEGEKVTSLGIQHTHFELPGAANDTKGLFKFLNWGDI